MEPSKLDLEALRTSVGDTLRGRFDLQGKVGDGAHAELWAARDRELGRGVVVRRVRAGAPEPDVRRLLVEAQVAAQLSHPNVAPLYSLEIDDDGVPCFTTQRVRGETLARHVERSVRAGDPRSGTYSLRRRLEIFVGVCDAIAYAHARGVYHRNLGAEAVMLGPFAEVYVTDWGFAQLGDASAGEPVALTIAPPSSISGPVVLQPASGLTPPKRDAEGEARDRRALAELLEALVMLTDQAPEVAARARRRLDPDLRAIVAGAHQAGRYKSVRELADEVRRYLRGERPEVVPDTLTRRLRRRVRRRPVEGLLALLALTMVVSGFAVVRTISHLSVETESSAERRELSRISGAVAERADQIGAAAAEVEAELNGARATLALTRSATVVTEALREIRLRTGAVRAYYVRPSDVFVAGAGAPGLAKLTPLGRPGVRWGEPLRREPRDPWTVSATTDVARADGRADGVVALDLPVAALSVITTRTPILGLRALYLVDVRGQPLDAQGPLGAPLDPAVTERIRGGLDTDILLSDEHPRTFVRVPPLGWYLVGEAERAW